MFRFERSRFYDCLDVWSDNVAGIEYSLFLKVL